MPLFVALPRAYAHGRSAVSRRAHSTSRTVLASHLRSQGTRYPFRNPSPEIHSTTLCTFWSPSQVPPRPSRSRFLVRSVGSHSLTLVPLIPNHATHVARALGSHSGGARNLPRRNGTSLNIDIVVHLPSHGYHLHAVDRFLKAERRATYMCVVVDTACP